MSGIQSGGFWRFALIGHLHGGRREIKKPPAGVDVRSKKTPGRSVGPTGENGWGWIAGEGFSSLAALRGFNRSRNARNGILSHVSNADKGGFIAINFYAI